MHFFGAWARQTVIETIAVVYEHTKRTQEMCSPIGRNNTKHFLCPIRSRHSLEFLEMVRWESVPRGSSARTWKLSSRIFSRLDWLPLGLRGWVALRNLSNLWIHFDHSSSLNENFSGGVTWKLATGRMFNLAGQLADVQSQVVLRPTPMHREDFLLVRLHYLTCSRRFGRWMNCWASVRILFFFTTTC